MTKERMRQVVGTVLALMVIAALGACASEQPIARTAYNCKVYTEQGCAKQVVASGGEVEFQSGSTIDLQGGSTALCSGAVNYTSGVTYTSNVVISGTLAITGSVSDPNSAVTIADSAMVDGAANAIQLTVQAYAGQSAGLVVFEGSNGNDMFTVSPAGNTVISGTLAVTGTSNLMGNLSDSGGALTVADNAIVDGAADAVQLIVQGNGTQTNNIFEVETSAANNLVTVDNSGNVAIKGTLAITGAVSDADGPLTIADALALTPISLTLTVSNTALTPVATSVYSLNSGIAATITLGACSVNGQLLTFIDPVNQTITIADSNIWTHDGAKDTMGQYDVMTLICLNTKWFQMGIVAANS